jgi:hypothetical protein
LRANILGFYKNLDLPFNTKKKPDDWQKTVAAIGKLRAQSVSSEL